MNFRNWLFRVQRSVLSPCRISAYRSLRGRRRSDGRTEIRQVIAESLETRVLLTADLAEGNAAEWSAFADDSAAVSVTDSASHVFAGSQSIQFTSASGTDTGLAWPAAGDANLSLTEQDFFTFRVYAENTTPIGWQGHFPVVVLHSPSGSFQYEPDREMIPEVGNGFVEIPLAGDGTWTRTSTGNPTFSEIDQLEIHYDTWDSGFTIYHDDVRFFSPTIVSVTNTGDSGAGSLRQAILDANASPTPVTVVFAIPHTDGGYQDVDTTLVGGDAHPDVFRIRPLTPLPIVNNVNSQPIRINGSSQHALTGDSNPFGPEIELDGSLAGPGSHGLIIDSGNADVRDLTIGGFSESGLLIRGTGAYAAGNYVGTDSTGMAAMPNLGAAGIQVENASGVLITSSLHNISLVSGNAGHGVLISGSDSIEVASSFIGVNQTGSAVLGNAEDGIAVDNSSQVNIGADNENIGNVISGNLHNGIAIRNLSEIINIQRSMIGVDVTGATELGNHGHGIETSSNSRLISVGTSFAGDGNVISGNQGDGFVAFGGVHDVFIKGNRVGTDVSGLVAVGNGGSGISLDGVISAEIGGDTPETRNIVSGNSTGLFARSGTENLAIRGNYFGTNAGGDAALGNQAIGIRLEGISSVSVVNNVSSGQQLGLMGIGLTSVQISGNFIGTNAGGNAAIPNTVHGIELSDSSNVVIGGNDSVLGNVVSGNAQVGIRLQGVTSSAVAGNLIGTDRSGTIAIGNDIGIAVGATFSRPSQFVQIGGLSEGEANLVAGNASNGISFDAVDSSVIHGNRIGFKNATGPAPLSNGGDGILLFESYRVDVSGNTVEHNGNHGIFDWLGHDNSVRNNIVSANAGDGIQIGSAPGAYVEGNSSYGNSRHGINVADGRFDHELIQWTTESGGNGHFYLLTPDSRTVTDTEFTATSLGGHLASITSAEENAFLTSQFGTENAWIGLSDKDSEGNFVWFSQEPLSFTGWLPNEPNGNDIENFVQITVDGWNDVPGHFQGRGVLEFETAPSAAQLASAFGITVVRNNFAGLAAGGEPVPGNDVDGLKVTSMQQVLIDGNVLSGNQERGLFVDNSRSVYVSGNKIGTSSAGTSSVRNHGGGASFFDSQQIVIAPGNVFSGNAGEGLWLSSVTGAVVLGSKFGTNAAGDAAIPNDNDGIHVDVGSTNVVIGGQSPGDRNIISGNQGTGVEFREESTSGNLLIGNYIGTDVTGMSAIPNSDGVEIEGAVGNTIGGPDETLRNLISGNLFDGVLIHGASAADNLILGNFIGTNFNGTLDLGNGSDGIQIQSAAGTRIRNNLISGNDSDGLDIFQGAVNTLLAANRIGTAANGTSPLGNAGNGIWISDGSADITIGGADPGDANHIAHNLLNGVLVTDSSIRVTISGNSIHSNGQNGIDLNNDGASPNDPEDADLGPNLLQNTPIVSGAQLIDSEWHITGTIDSTPNAPFTVELFQNTAVTVAGPFAQKSLGTVVVTTDATGHAQFTLATPQTVSSSGGIVIVATATDPTGNTSEFSPAVTVAVPEIAVDLGGVVLNNNVGVTDFGTARIAGTTISRTFRVRNTGNAPLSLGALSLPAGFTLTNPLLAVIAPGASDVFTVRLDTNAAGTKSGQIEFSTSDSDENPFRISITGVVSLTNVAPVVGAFDTAVTYAENAAPVLLDFNATVSDIDSTDFAGGRLTVAITGNAQTSDRISIRDTGTGVGQIGTELNAVLYAGVPIGTFSGTTSLVVTLNSSATPAAVQALLRNVTFHSLSENPVTSPRTVRVTLTDGDGGTSNLPTKTVNVTRVNDASIVGAFDAAVTYVENAAPVLLDSNATVVDVDSTDLAGGRLTVAITSNAQTTDRISIRSTGNGVGQIATELNAVLYAGVPIGTFSGTTSLVVTLNSSATPAAVQALLRNVTFHSLSENPVTLPRTVRVTLTDGDGGTSNLPTKTVNVTRVNDAPIVGAFDTAVTYAENAAPVLLDFNATVSDIDSTDFAGGRLTVAITGNTQTSDRISIRDTGTGVGQIGTELNAVLYAGVPIGTFSGTTSLVVTLNSSATPAAVQALLRNITFHSLSENPVTSPRTVRVTLTDGDGGTSNLPTKTVNVTRVNDAPIVGAFDTAVTYVENAAPVLLDSNATVSDIDSTDFAGGRLTVAITANAQTTDRISIRSTGNGVGQIATELNAVLYGGVSIGTFSGTTSLVVTLNSSATPAAVQALLRNITFHSLSENPVTSPRTVRVTLTDGDGGTSNLPTKTVNVTRVNDAPIVGAFDTAVTYVENAVPVLLDSNATIIDIDSTDFAGGRLTVAITGNVQTTDRISIRNSGTGVGQIATELNAVLYGGVSIGTFSGTTSLIVTLNSSATPAAVQALLRNITFHSLSENPVTSPRTVRVTLTDGDGGTSNLPTKTVNVTAVNDLPVIGPLATGQIFIPGGAAVSFASVATVADADSSNFDTGRLTVRVSSNAQASDLLSITHQGTTAGKIGVTAESGITFGGVLIGTFSGGTGTTPLVISFNNIATSVAVQTLIRSLTYRSTLSTASTAARTISLSLTDGDGGTSNLVTTTLSVPAPAARMMSVPGPTEIDSLFSSESLSEELMTI